MSLIRVELKGKMDTLRKKLKITREEVQNLFFIKYVKLEEFLPNVLV